MKSNMKANVFAIVLVGLLAFPALLSAQPAGTISCEQWINAKRLQMNVSIQELAKCKTTLLFPC